MNVGEQMAAGTRTATFEDRRKFERNGVEVDELVLVDQGKRKLVWCLHPFEALHVGGRMNYLVHAALTGDKEACRKLLEPAFDRIHGETAA